MLCHFNGVSINFAQRSLKSKEERWRKERCSRREWLILGSGVTRNYRITKSLRTSRVRRGSISWDLGRPWRSMLKQTKLKTSFILRVLGGFSLKQKKNWTRGGERRRRGTCKRAGRENVEGCWAGKPLCPTSTYSADNRMVIKARSMSFQLRVPNTNCFPSASCVSDFLWDELDWQTTLSR